MVYSATQMAHRLSQFGCSPLKIAIWRVAGPQLVKQDGRRVQGVADSPGRRNMSHPVLPTSMLGPQKARQLDRPVLTSLQAVRP